MTTGAQIILWIFIILSLYVLVRVTQFIYWVGKITIIKLKGTFFPTATPSSSGSTLQTVDHILNTPSTPTVQTLITTQPPTDYKLERPDPPRVELKPTVQANSSSWLETIIGICLFPFSLIWLLPRLFTPAARPPVGQQPKPQLTAYKIGKTDQPRVEIEHKPEPLPVRTKTHIPVTLKFGKNMWFRSQLIRLKDCNSPVFFKNKNAWVKLDTIEPFNGKVITVLYEADKFSDLLCGKCQFSYQGHKFTVEICKEERIRKSRSRRKPRSRRESTSGGWGDTDGGD